MHIAPYIVDSIVFLCPPVALWCYLRQRRQRAARQELDLAAESWKRGCDLIDQAEWQEAATALADAQTLIAHQPEIEARLRFYRAYALEQVGDIDPALEEYATLDHVTVSKSDLLYRHLAAYRRARLLVEVERGTEAEGVLKQVATDAMCAGWNELWLAAMRALISLDSEMGCHAQVLQRASQALQLARKLGDDESHAVILDLVGGAHLAVGHYTEALRSYEQSLRLLRKDEEHRAPAVTTAGNWFPGLARGRANPWLGRWLREDERVNNVLRQARISYELACLYVAREDLEQASELLYRSLSLYRRLGDQAGIRRVRSTMLGLGVVTCREASADQMTSRDIERGIARVIESKQAR